MYVIPIRPETLNLIALLNDGVHPELEDFGTVFIVHDDAPNEIEATHAFLSRLHGPFPTSVKILCL